MQVYLVRGPPPIRRPYLATLSGWALPVAGTTDAQYFIMSVLFLQSRPAGPGARVCSPPETLNWSGIIMSTFSPQLARRLSLRSTMRHSCASLMSCVRVLRMVGAHPVLALNLQGALLRREVQSQAGVLVLQMVLPIWVIALYHAFAYAAQRLGGTSLWQRYGAVAHSFLSYNQVRLHCTIEVLFWR